MAFIYILHFDTPLSHAEHYSGCTESIKGRLTAHARGAGSRLCRALIENGIEWRLGALYQCSKAHMRRIERHLKDQHNAARYCEYCTRTPTRLDGTTPYPPELLPFATNSEQIKAQMLRGILTLGTITVRITNDHEPATTMKFVRSIMDADKDALGFIPAGGSEGMSILEKNGLIAIVSNNGEDVGYACFTIGIDRVSVNIHQCAIRDDARLCGHGAALIKYLSHRFPKCTLTAKVREDLAANHFWQAMGFKLTRQSEHKSSGWRGNHYFLPVQTQE